MEIYRGACRYCGQTAASPAHYESQEDADEVATRGCSCEQARRDRAAEAGRSRLQGLLVGQPPEVADLLLRTLNSIAAGQLVSIAVQMDGRTKLKIKSDSKGNLVVQKVTTTVEQEVV